MRIATWNVNSIKARLPTVLEVLGAIIMFAPLLWIFSLLFGASE